MKLPGRQSYNEGTHVELQQSPPSYANSFEFKASSQLPSPLQLAEFSMRGAAFSRTSTACGIGTGDGAAVGVLVGDGVRAVHLFSWQYASIEQSLLATHCSPRPHGAHEPPQSTSGSSPFCRPSVQATTVGEGVGECDGAVGDADGEIVGDVEGTLVALKTVAANTGRRVGDSVGFSVGIVAVG